MEASLQVEGMIFLTKETTYNLEVREGYVGTSPHLSPVQLQIGRKLVAWNQLDDAWRLGVWQPRFRLDYIRPDVVALTGAFVSLQLPYFQLIAFGSPIFIPERGESISVENGKFKHPSPWFLPPSSRVNILEQETPVSYRLKLPEADQVMLNSGGSVMARFGKEKGVWIQGGYALKPMNQLLLGYDGFLQLTERMEDMKAKVTFHPRVLYHQLYSAELGYEGETAGVWFSFLEEHPIRDRPSPEWTTQEVKVSRLISPTLEWRPSGQNEDSPRLKFSYLRHWGGDAPDRGPYASPGDSVFESRYPFISALQLGYQSKLPWEFGRNFNLYTNIIYDLAYDATLVSLAFRYTPGPRWAFGIGTDLLTAARNDIPSGTSTKFINRYKANDRIYMGVSYVF